MTAPHLHRPSVLLQWRDGWDRLGRSEATGQKATDMSESELEDGLTAATARFDRALARLDQSAKNLGNRVRQLNRIEVDTQRLVHERARLATELDKTSARAKRLDDSAHDVSRRLVEAMETVRAVLAKTE
jgi:ABC-type transporter Mla subunit MlaD